MWRSCLGIRGFEPALCKRKKPLIFINGFLKCGGAAWALEDLNPLYVNEKKPLIFINGFLKCGGAAWALEDLNPLYVNEKKPLINSGFLMCGGEIGI